MNKYFSALFCALLVLYLTEPIKCGRFSSRGSSRGSSHSYPSSHGLSGGSHRTSHSYPSSSGSHSYPPSHGSSGSHSYPPSHGSSGSHSYPPSHGSSGSHGYPPSGGLSGGGSGYPSSSGSKYPSSSGSKYPSSSGGHSYPSSGNGLSGSSHGSSSRYPNSHSTHTTVHHHYHYSPPTQIRYAAPGQRVMSYPVYHGTPPTYVYQYRDSGSKYGTLLTGLALLNLGALAGSVYANSHNRQTYKPQPGESCRFAVKKSNGDYEETKIDCMLISSFIYEEEAKAASGKTSTNTTTVTTTVTNTTVVNMTNPAAPVNMSTMPPPPMTPMYQMLPNGTLVPVAMPVNVTAPGTPNATLPNPTTGVNGTVTVTTTTTNTTVVNAIDVKGKEIEVTPGMECFVIRTTTSSRMKRHVPCGLLQSYATQSLKRNSAAHNIPTFTILFAIAAFALY